MTLQHRQNEPNTRSQTRSKFRECRPTLMTVWAYHFAASIAIILLGSIQNEGRKYIPIDTGTIEDDCSKAFLNIFASSDSDSEAIICCTKDTTSGICQALPSFLLFAKRLSKIPEAWLVPLFPLMVRWVVQYIQKKECYSKYTMRRFFLYFGLLLFRGFVLYLLFDYLESLIVQPAVNECWYDANLKSYQGSCQGQTFDYSDHVVLFFAQILPIPFTEVLFSFVVPYWKDKSFLVPTILSTTMVFLYLITFVSVYRTVGYFHTLPEIWVGYLISLLIQVPLFLITSTSVMEPTRDYFFG